jgi:hypothetical protein
MKHPRIRCVLVVTLLVPLSGCPIAVPIMLGTWLFTLEPAADVEPIVKAVVLLPDGDTEQPDPRPEEADRPFNNDTAWQQTGLRILLVEEGLQSIETHYHGRLLSSTTASGDYERVVGNRVTPLGTWSAHLLE